MVGGMDGRIVKMVKIYIASSFSLIPKIEKVCQILEDNGHTVLVKWWTRIGLKLKFQELSREDFYNEPECRNAYERDLEGVMNCDVLLFVADDEIKSYCGANVELGMALGNSKRCIVLGDLQNSAMYYPVYWAKDIDDVLYVLSKLEEFGLVK